MADKDHWNKYGRLVLGDEYVVMEDGLVPSVAYDIAKRDTGARVSAYLLEKASDALEFLPRDHNHDYPRLKAHRTPQLDLFSRTDIECLNMVIFKYTDMDLEELWERAH